MPAPKLPAPCSLVPRTAEQLPSPSQPQVPALQPPVLHSCCIVPSTSLIGTRPKSSQALDRCESGAAPTNSHMVLGGGREEPYGCTLYHVRLRKQDVTHFSDCHRCCLWVSVHCSTFSFHLFISEHTTALPWALIFPNVQIWDTSLHLSMYFGFPPTKHSRRKVYICTMSP